MALEAKVTAEGWWAGEPKIKLNGKSNSGDWYPEDDSSTGKSCR